MESKKIAVNLEKLAVAALISEGDFDYFQESNVLKIPFDTKKALYLKDLVKESGLERYIDINLKRGQFSIHSHSVLKTLQKQWYKDKKKIFTMILDPDLLNVESIITSVNLFGVRKLESILIPTSIDKEYIKSIAYCMEQKLKVTVIPTATSLKIMNIPKFIINSIKEIPAIDSAELINFLTEKEKKKIIEGALT